MNNYNMDVLPLGEDISSSCTLTSSLAEHSYCASAMSTSNVPEESAVVDLFGSSEVLCTDMDGSIKFPIEIGDVNLDGFNYSVPLEATNCGSIELENMWSGLTNETGTAVVEIAAINEDEGQQIIESGITDNVEVAPVVMDVGPDEDESRRKVTARKGKGRRTDFIQNFQKRRSHFDFYFQKLKSDFKRIKSRTGCSGTLSATYEGKSYEDAVAKSSFPSPAKSKHNNKLLLAQSISSTTTDASDDHRYAATILTQNVSSSAVRDHQYDEKTITSAPDSDTTTDYDEDDLHDTDIIKYRKKRSKRYRYDYVKVRWERTQIFSKVVRSLFSSKIILEQRTGADIKLVVEYEGNCFNDDNYKNASNIITSRRKHLKSTKFNLCPKSVPNYAQLNLNSTPAPLTFIVPNFTSFPFQIPCVLPSPTESMIESCGNFPISFAVPSNDPDISQSVVDTTYNVGDSGNLNNSNLDAGDSDSPTLEMVEHPVVVNCIPNSSDQVAVTGNDFTSGAKSTTSDTFTPVKEGIQNSGQQFMEFQNSKPNNSLEVTVAREMQESFTNTEPICSICSSSSEISNSTLKVIGDHSTSKSFWIRCNDPFCYDMVHASCVGFVVTHKAHLRQLPAFYCKYHRKN